MFARRQLTKRTDNKTRGFTLIELLVVISIIALLLSILMPALGKVKEQARTVVCMAHIRTMALIFPMYAEDYNGLLPHYATWPSATKPWHDLINPYAGHKVDSGELFGATYNRCPSERENDWINPHTYGINYPGVMGYYEDIASPGWTKKGGSKLVSIPSSVFIGGDVKNNYDGTSVILHPTAHPGNMWVLDTDHDGDGVDDSASGEILMASLGLPGGGVGFFNGFSPRHGNKGNFVFADGSTRTVKTREWATNDSNMWGSKNGYK